METDPIRDALEAAALEISALHLEWDGDAPEVWDCHRHMAVAAVAAFNRRIAEHFRERGRINDHATAIELEDIAAAVERAAKEGA